jgi:hypothetical protein
MTYRFFHVEIFFDVTCCNAAEFTLTFRKELMPQSLWYNILYLSIEQEEMRLIASRTWFILLL